MIVAVWCADMRAAMNTMHDMPISSKFVLHLMHDMDIGSRLGVYVVYRVTDEQAKMIRRWGNQQKPACYMLFETDK